MSREYASAVSAAVVAPRASVRLNRVASLLIVAGLALSVPALLDESDRARLGFAYVWSFAFVWAIALGALFFVGLQHLTHAVWSVVVRRVAEVFAAAMWVVGMLSVPILLFVCLPRAFGVFAWADTTMGDDLLGAKRAYLNAPFFVLRAIVYFAVWIGFARYFVSTSLKQDNGALGVAASLAMRRRTAPFTVLFALTVTFAGIDWLMSLDPYWFSTIFGVYVFAGMVVAALAAITLTTLWLRDGGLLGRDVVTEEHLYNLGALLFAFVCFWGYIAFSQYMLIWYANVPEEAFYLRERLEGGWLGVSVVLVVVRFVIPFVVLLSRRAKMNPRVLGWISLLMLFGQLVDLYWLVMPEVHRARPVLGWQESGPPLLLIGVLLLHLTRFFRRHAALAVGDPLLAQSRAFRL